MIARLLPLCLALLASLSFLTVAEEKPKPRQPDSPWLALELSQDQRVLTVTLRNSGKTPITVDRELVFLLEVTLETRDRTPLQSLRKPAFKREAAAERFISVPPGGQLVRSVDLGNGFTRFNAWHGTLENHNHIFQGEEEVVRMRADDQLRSVKVRYTASFDFHGAFLTYTGLNATDLGLHMGPLEASLAIPAKDKP